MRVLGAGLSGSVRRATLRCMGIKAVVRNGKLEIDEPVTLPEGTVLDLVVDDGGDDLDDAERALLHAALRESIAQAERGELIPAEDVFRELRSRSR